MRVQEGDSLDSTTGRNQARVWFIFFVTIFVLSSAGLIWIWFGAQKKAEASRQTLPAEALAALESIQKENDALVVQLSGLKNELASLNEQASATAATDSADSATNAKSDVPAQTKSGKINLKTASQAQLETLPGIGPSKAQAILAYQKSPGFKAPKDLMSVKGIGEKTYAKLAPLVTVE